MGKISRALIICAIVAVVAACRAAPVYNVADTPLTSSSSKTQIGDVTEVIKKAGAGLGWQMKEVSPGYMIGTLALRSHIAVVDIRYDTDSFSIGYRDSTNLNYDGSSIHGNYNGWVKNLQSAILGQSSTL